MATLFITQAVLASGDEISLRAYWDRIEFVLEPFAMGKGLRAGLSRLKWLRAEGVVVDFEELSQMELKTSPDHDIGHLTVKSKEESYQLTLPEEAGRRIMGLWMATKWGNTDTQTTEYDE